MRLQTKLLTGIGSIMVLAFAVVEYQGLYHDRTIIRDTLIGEGRTLQGVIVAMRRVYQRAFLDNAIPVNAQTLALLPAHSLPLMSKEFSAWSRTGLSFRTVSDRPRNPENAADAMEQEAMTYFRSHPSIGERVVRFKDRQGRAGYHFSTPLWVVPQCMACHGKAEDAPSSIRERYSHAFNYRVGDLRGLLSIRIPAESVENRVLEMRHREAATELVIFLLCFVTAIGLLQHLVIRRIQALEAAAARISEGDYQTPVKIKSDDEIGQVSKAFNHMTRAIARREEALQDKEAGYRRILDNIHEVIFQTDIGGNWEFLSPAWRDIMQLEPADCLGQPASGFVHPDEHQAFSGCLVDLVSGRLQHYQKQLRFPIDGGQYRHIEMNAKPLFDRGGQAIGCTGTLRDLTARTEAMTRASRANELNRDILESISEIFMAVDQDWRVTYANQHVERLGMSPEQLIGKEVWEALPELSSFFYKEWHRAMTERISTSREGYYPPLERWLETRTYPIEGGLTVYFQDVTDQHLAMDAVRSSEGRLRAVLENSPVMIAVKDLDGRYILANPRFASLFGLDEPPIGRHDDELFSAQLADLLYERDRRALRSNEALELEEHLGPDGEISLLSTRFPLFDAQGTAQGLCWMATDVTERLRVEEELRLAATVFEGTVEAITIADAKGNIVAVNPAFNRITGYTTAEVLGRNPSMLQSGRHDPEFFRDMWNTIEQAGYWRGEVWNRRKNGEVYPQWLTINTVRNQEGEVSHYVGLSSDMSAIKRSEEKLDHLAHHDPLTELPNRLLFNSRLEHALERSLRNEERIALLFVDLDRFKTVNDGLGHPVGDELLRQVARLLRRQIRSDDTLARLGGDEFIILMEDIKEPQDAALVAEKLIQAMARPFWVEDNELFLTASIGISVYPEHGSDPIGLLKSADTAMFRAKEQGRNSFQFSTHELTSLAFERQFLEMNMRRALEREEFVLYYQPQIETGSRRILGAEALVRWQSPELGLVSPAKFIPLAEETGLIREIGEWVLHTACQQAAAWRQAGLPEIVMAVNVSSRQIQSKKLLDSVNHTLSECAFPAHLLELEITESSIMQHSESILRTLDSLRDLGIKLAIDDFGTGYSSLSYLKRFAVTKLKIDQSFVRDIPDDHNDEAITRAIIAMGKSLQLSVIAEGVETTEQEGFLQQAGCDEMQGYLFSRPVPALQFEVLLREGLSAHISPD